MGSFDLAVEACGAGSDLDVVEALVEQVPVERLPESGTVVCLDSFDLEWQLGEDVVEELDRGLLVVAFVSA